MTQNENSAHFDDNLITELRGLATSFAVQAGEFAWSARQRGVNVAATKSSSVDVVTQTDRDTENLLTTLIRQARPDDGLLGEEGATRAGTSGLTWIVDPIDGTVNFLYGIPAWSVSVAVVAGPPVPGEWKALAGAVCNPVLGEVYEAGRGQGAVLNGEPIAVNQDVTLERALIATGFSYSSKLRAEQAAVIQRVLPKVRDIRRMGSAALDLCALASGRCDGYFERDTKPWDYAAGLLIAEEAGAKIGGVTVDNSSPELEGLIFASVETIFKELKQLITPMSN